MYIRCVRLGLSKSKNKQRVVIYYNRQWVILRQALDLLESDLTTNQRNLIHSSSSNVLKFLDKYSNNIEMKSGVEHLLHKLSKCENDHFKSKIYFQPNKSNRFIFPFEIKSLRDFSLWEQHMIDSKRGYLKRFMPLVYYIICILELFFPKPFFALKPPNAYYENPIYYVGNHQNIYENNQTIPWPSFTQALDFELELAAVVCRHVKYHETPVDSIGGFLLFNDFSARDLQKREMFESGFGPVKTKSFANGFGYDIITKDELLDNSLLFNLNAEVSIYDSWGVRYGRCYGDTKYPIFSFEDMIKYANYGEHLYPGDVLGLGTVPGCSGMESNLWVQGGDKVKLELPELNLSLTHQIGYPKKQKLYFRNRKPKTICSPCTQPFPYFCCSLLTTILFYLLLLLLTTPIIKMRFNSNSFTKYIDANELRPSPDDHSFSLPDNVESFYCETNNKQSQEDNNNLSLFYSTPNDQLQIVFPFSNQLETKSGFSELSQPLSIEPINSTHSLLVDADSGVYIVEKDSGEKTLIIDRDETGQRLNFADYAHVMQDINNNNNTIAFISESSFKRKYSNYINEILSQESNGKILKYNFQNNTVSTQVNNISFPNGIASSIDGKFIVFCSSSTMNIYKHYLVGSHAGNTEVWISGKQMPGICDNIIRDEKGDFWISIPKPKSLLLLLAQKFKFLSQLDSNLLHSISSMEKPSGLVAVVDGNLGIIKAIIYDWKCNYLCQVTHVAPCGKYLYYSSLFGSGGRILRPNIG